MRSQCELNWECANCICILYIIPVWGTKAYQCSRQKAGDGWRCFYHLAYPRLFALFRIWKPGAFNGPLNDLQQGCRALGVYWLDCMLQISGRPLNPLIVESETNSKCKVNSIERQAYAKTVLRTAAVSDFPRKNEC